MLSRFAKRCPWILLSTCIPFLALRFLYTQTLTITEEQITVESVGQSTFQQSLAARKSSS